MCSRFDDGRLFRDYSKLSEIDLCDEIKMLEFLFNYIKYYR